MKNLKDIINEGVISTRPSSRSEIWDIIYDMEKNRGNVPMKRLLFRLKNAFRNLDGFQEFIEDGNGGRLTAALLTMVDLIAKELNVKLP
jgi:hypothetical protein